jgi:hypothetical protein
MLCYGGVVNHEHPGHRLFRYAAPAARASGPMARPGIRYWAPKREVAVTFLVVDTETRFVFAAVAVHISRGGPLVRLFFNFLKGKSILNFFI